MGDICRREVENNIIPKIGFSRVIWMAVLLFHKWTRHVTLRGMSTLIFGVGTGLFLILTLWIVAAVIFLISLRIEKKIGAIAIVVASVCTIILVSIPRASEKGTTHETKIYDHLFIWRILLLILLIISSIVGFVGYITVGLIEPVKPIRITNWVMNGSVPVIVNFHAEWCDPCKILTPKLIELIEPMDKLHLAIVNVELNPELVHIFEVKAVPAVIAISNGLVVDKFIGLVDTEMIENLIQKLTDKPVDSNSKNTEV
ncbi:hypothetical protein KM043_008870 [Ampulex compressa]|nr:hypothetical protein KM043_008870 [Ampulex compressa]